MAAEAKPKPEETDLHHIDASTSTRTSASSSSAELRRPPTPKRRNTDEVSIHSEWSDGPVRRRSALRRSSSLSKGLSPRRVRFEVEGKEVLPTSSPAAAESILSETNSSNSLLDDSDDEPEQIEDIDEPPPPKRISSSQALRVLSRSPLVDDGTQWITVSAPPDGSASVAVTNGFSKEDLEDEDLETDSELSQMNITSPPQNIHAKHVEVPPTSIDEDGDETPSDDDMLDMPPLHRVGSSGASMLSPTFPAPASEHTSPTTSSHTPDNHLHTSNNLNGAGEDINGGELRFDEDDSDELFQFDEQPTPGPRHHPPEEEPELEDLVQADKEEPILSEYSSSPAREIAKPAPAKIEIPKSTGLIGSYKGHPFSMPIVSPEIHAQAASLGPISSFVGSVHGRTGPDESDVQSFRNSVIGSGPHHGFSGTPRSMSERMMLDDLMEGTEEGRR